MMMMIPTRPLILFDLKLNVYTYSHKLETVAHSLTHPHNLFALSLSLSFSHSQWIFDKIDCAHALFQIPSNTKDVQIMTIPNVPEDTWFINFLMHSFNWEWIGWRFFFLVFGFFAYAWVPRFGGGWNSVKCFLSNLFILPWFDTDAFPPTQEIFVFQLLTAHQIILLSNIYKITEQEQKQINNNNNNEKKNICEKSDVCYFSWAKRKKKECIIFSVLNQ